MAVEKTDLSMSVIRAWHNTLTAATSDIQETFRIMDVLDPGDPKLPLACARGRLVAVTDFLGEIIEEHDNPRDVKCPGGEE